MIDFQQINSNWTLFLDRDGVINKRLIGDYVKHWGEFEFLSNTLTALKQFTAHFGRIVVVTNQQGIYKQLMTREDLAGVHENMLGEIQQAGGRIDQVYFCPNSTADDPTQCRKPRIGMALQAKADFPEIDFSQSIMVGDSVTDLQFGRNAGMKTVWVAPGPLSGEQASLHDLHVQDLGELAALLSA